MRQLALVGSILLACFMGLASAASAHTRYLDPYGAAARIESAPAYVEAAPSAARVWRHARLFRRSHARLGQPLSIQPAFASMADLVLAAARRHGVPASLAYGVASVESGFRPGVRSHAGAIGLMGLMPATARGLGCRGSLTNPSVNADCGVRYLASIMADHPGDLRRTAALYNQGRFARRISTGASRYALLVISRGRRIPA